MTFSDGGYDPDISITQIILMWTIVPLLLIAWGNLVYWTIIIFK